MCACVCGQELDPELVQHLCRLGVPPAAVALPWMCRAFAGYLPVRGQCVEW